MSPAHEYVACLGQELHSLALRLRDAGVAAVVICQYVDVEQDALDGLYRIAEAKLLAAQKATDARYHACH